jgi:PAS domain S-box-containing protein
LAARKENGYTTGKGVPVPPNSAQTETRLHTAIPDIEKEQLRRELEALRQSETGFRAMFDHIPIGVYRTTPDGKVLMANAALLQMLRCRSFQELSDRNLQGAPYEPEYSRDWFNKEIAKQGELRGLEADWTLTDGTRLRVRENARVVLGRDGSVLYYEGTVEDIGRRSESEELLKAKADFLEEVVSNASIGIFVIDEDNHYVLINPECGRIVGHVPDDWTGKEAGLNVHPEDQGKALAHFIQALSGEQNECEIRIQAADSGYRNCRINISPMMLGGRAHVLGLVSDVTSLRSSEQDLMQKRSYGLNTIFVLAITEMAKALEPDRLEASMRDFEQRFAEGFQTLFEDDMQLMGSYENPDGRGNAGREAVFKRFLRFYSSLLRLMGARTEYSQVQNEATFEILDCQWLDEARRSPVPCRVCRTILCDSYGWTGLGGTAEPAATQAAGSKTCVFKFHMGPLHHPPEQARLPDQ